VQTRRDHLSLSESDPACRTPGKRPPVHEREASSNLSPVPRLGGGRHGLPRHAVSAPRPRTTRPDGRGCVSRGHPPATTAVLTSFVHSSPGESTVFTDAWASYVNAPGSRNGPPPAQGRSRGRQSVHLLPWDTAFRFPRTVLRGILHCGSPAHFHRYLDEFVFRFDHRWRRRSPFRTPPSRPHPVPTTSSRRRESHGQTTSSPRGRQGQG
jgi:hypothetical protein